MEFSTDTSVVFLDQVSLVRLGIFRLDLEKKTYFLALGMGNSGDREPEMALHFWPIMTFNWELLG